MIKVIIYDNIGVSSNGTLGGRWVDYNVEFYQTEKGKVPFSSDLSRIFYFCLQENTFVLLHGYVKKSQKIPARELDRARKHKADYERRCGDG